ncbi:hypothetical protein [Nostoc sp.]|uniref:hypothetical protein n=1 Tax=Nostoc sp. TaxID=1180 RepID=UPI002FF816A0
MSPRASFGLTTSAYLDFATSTPAPSSVRLASRREAEMLNTSRYKSLSANPDYVSVAGRSTGMGLEDFGLTIMELFCSRLDGA